MAQQSSLSRFMSYHVFLSFRGQDTRKNFTDHLYKALVDARIRTFQDTPELERGEPIREELEKAIRESQGSVIVFSKDYTSSSWCLDELAFILERKDKFNHFVMPVFYDVSPSELKNKAEEISKVPKHKEKQSTEKIHGWKEALREVAELAGMNLAGGHEAKFIQDIVIEIKKKLGRRVPLSNLQKQIENKLSSVNPVLNDAEGKLLKFKKDVKPWLDELKEAVYDAQDLLQEIKTEALRQEIENKEGSSTSKEQEFISCPSHAFDHRAEAVLNILESILERRSLVLCLGMEAGAEDKATQTRESTPLVEPYVYGRDEEKERFVALLLSDDKAGNQIGVIPIVGMGGIGKTTLAGLVYNDDRVEQHFDLRAWVCISKEFNVLKISQDIYGSLTGNDCHMTNLQVLQSKLQTTLRGKRFFLVVDDMWNYNYDQLEEIIMRPLQSGAHGSKIIVTTRDDKVADRMASVDAHRLRPISDTDGWSLLKKHAFKNAGVAHAHAHLEEIGTKIVEKCGGLPLAIKSLGGLLRSSLSVDEWKRILNSDMWELSPNESNILPSLWLSYINLPLPLKRCFAYCSIFPKNYKFETSELIYLWKAEDLLQPEENKIAEEIGQDYLSDLISRSFFQLSSNPKKFIMHDLINDLASFVSGKFCFRWEGNDSTPNNLSNTRHLWISPFDDDDISRNVEVLQQAKHLRTFLSQPCMNCVSLPPLGQLPFLTELQISWLGGVVSVGSEFYYSDGKNEPFRSLRSLTFSCMRGWKVWCHVEGGVFPNLVQLSVSWCWNLRRTLALDSWPAQMETLFPSLQFLYIHDCPKLECFPADGFPSNLKSLSIWECKKLNAKDLQNLMKGLRRLTALETLRLDFDCDEKVDWIAKEEEALLPNTLTRLQIHNLNCETIDAAKWFGHLNSLLFFEFSNSRVLRCLPESGLPTSLQTLEIANCPALQCLPESGLPTSLQTLEIRNCPAIQCSPDYGLPSSLSRLYISSCPLLEDWRRSHYAHIPEPPYF